MTASSTGATRPAATAVDDAARLRGVLPVLSTPFHADGRVDYTGFARIVDHVVATGVAGVMFPGFASEFHKLSDDERWRLNDIVLERTHSRPHVAAVISVANHATYLAVEAVKRAVSGGADAINVLPPYFLRPPAAEIQAHLEAVVDAAAPVPVIVQLAPDLTGSGLTVDRLLALRRALPNFGVVKVETNPAGPMVSALAAADPPLASLVGYAGLHMLDAAARGARGVQPGCSFAEIYVEIWNAWTTGDEVRATDLHRRLLPFLTYWMQDLELIVQVEKLISVRRGLIASDHCRRPRRSLDRMEVQSVDRFLTEFAEELPPVS
ncbi:MAG TPA: dihydrodipicolinate synthase family protein [Jatrophihabitans sp.]|nr:dihydrodipicolinate synthase family protein [Jatrophihabitans sp.]